VNSETLGEYLRWPVALAQSRVIHNQAILFSNGLEA